MRSLAPLLPARALPGLFLLLVGLAGLGFAAPPAESPYSARPFALPLFSPDTEDAGATGDSSSPFPIREGGGGVGSSHPVTPPSGDGDSPFPFREGGGGVGSSHPVTPPSGDGDSPFPIREGGGGVGSSHSVTPPSGDGDSPFPIREGGGGVGSSRLPDSPTRLLIPAILLDAPINPVAAVEVNIAGKAYSQWPTPDERAAGWHHESARLGEPGNTVLNGHHNIEGEVFARLHELEVGDRIMVQGEDGYLFHYLVANIMILPEKYRTVDVRMDNARWILPSADERLTLVTCWPAKSNTHRLIIVASPWVR